MADSLGHIIIETRRDIAMLGLIHRSILGYGPRDTLRACFSPLRRWSHSKHLRSHRGPRHLQMLPRSALGHADVYNLLPARVVEQKSVASMQHELQMLLKFREKTIQARKGSKSAWTVQRVSGLRPQSPRKPTRPSESPSRSQHVPAREQARLSHRRKAKNPANGQVPDPQAGRTHAKRPAQIETPEEFTKRTESAS